MRREALWQTIFWREGSNEHQLHSSLGYLVPPAFTRFCAVSMRSSLYLSVRRILRFGGETSSSLSSTDADISGTSVPRRVTADLEHSIQMNHSDRHFEVESRPRDRSLTDWAYSTSRQFT